MLFFEGYRFTRDLGVSDNRLLFPAPPASLGGYGQLAVELLLRESP